MLKKPILTKNAAYLIFCPVKNVQPIKKHQFEYEQLFGSPLKVLEKETYLLSLNSPSRYIAKQHLGINTVGKLILFS